MAKYIGRATTGLGFYHVEISETDVMHVLFTKNWGVVYVEDGEATKVELAKEIFIIYIRRTGHGE